MLELLDTVEYDYPNFHLSMDCFICEIKAGDLVLKEHEASAWLTKETGDDERRTFLQLSTDEKNRL